MIKGQDILDDSWYYWLEDTGQSYRCAKYRKAAHRFRIPKIPKQVSSREKSQVAIILILMHRPNSTSSRASCLGLPRDRDAILAPQVANEKHPPLLPFHSNIDLRLHLK